MHQNKAVIFHHVKFSYTLRWHPGYPQCNKFVLDFISYKANCSLFCLCCTCCREYPNISKYMWNMVHFNRKTSLIFLSCATGIAGWGSGVWQNHWEAGSWFSSSRILRIVSKCEVYKKEGNILWAIEHDVSVNLL